MTTTLDRQAAYSGTKEVSPTLRFDVARLEAYLAGKVPGFAGPLRVKQFRGGQSNPTYLLETPARRYVLRRKPPGKLLPSAHAVDREYRAIAALHAQGFPVAEPVVYCAEEAVVGTAFYVMGYADGRVFWEPHMPQSNPAERRSVYDAMPRSPGCTRSSPPRSGSATSARAKITSRARSTAGRSSTAPRKPRRSRRWTS